MSQISHRFVASLVICAMAFGIAGYTAPVYGQPAPAVIYFETELSEMSLTGGPTPLPFASDPTGLLTDADGGPATENGWGFVNTEVAVTLSSDRNINPGPLSVGEIWAFQGDSPAGPGDPNNLPPIDPDALHGETFWVDSFFDVFFDITVADVDDRPGRDFFLGLTEVSLEDLGPVPVGVTYLATFDKDAPDFGLFPPAIGLDFSWQGLIEIPLPFDINLNGALDTIKVTSASLGIQPGAAPGSYVATASIEGGVIDDQFPDPPFTLGGLSGPTTATSTLANPQAVVPVPAAVWMGLSMLGGLSVVGRLRRKS